jgi:hypothetical protein
VPLPTIYVIDAQMNSAFPDYCFQLAKCVLPPKGTLNTQLVNTTSVDGAEKRSTFDKIYAKYKAGLILRVLRRDNS